MGVVGGAADEPAVEVEARRPGTLQRCDHLLDLRHHLGANPVAGQEKEGIGGAHSDPAGFWGAP